MRHYSQLADLEALLLNILDENIRAYAREAVASYSAGAYRSAIVSIWIAVVYDLYKKFRELSEVFDDGAAKQCLEEIEKIRNSPDKKRVTAWERTILDNAFNEVKMLTPIEHEHLNRIQEDRHRCAHPALDAEGFLFQPSPELARTHIRTAIEVILSQPPVIGKAAGNALIRDVEGRYFADDLESVRKALKGRHLPSSEKYRLNIFTLCLKKILYLEPDDENIIARYILVFNCFLNEYREGFESLNKASLEKILEKTKDNRFPFLLRLLSIEQSLWYQASELIKQKIKSFIKQQATLAEKVGIVHLFSELKYDIVLNFNSLSRSEKQRFVKVLGTLCFNENNYKILEGIIRVSIDKFTNSGSYAGSRKNADEYLRPVIPLLNAADVEYLLKQVLPNSQLIDCAYIMEEVFEYTIDKFPNTLPSWKEFVEQKKDVWGNMSTLERLMEL